MLELLTRKDLEELSRQYTVTISKSTPSGTDSSGTGQTFQLIVEEEIFFVNTFMMLANVEPSMANFILNRTETV